MTDPAQHHTDQIEYWNGVGAVHWLTQQDATDRMLAEIAEIALGRAAVSPGETVIDVGCGCGATSLELARRVGLSGQVIALDVSAPLLERAGIRLGRCPWARTVLADAATHSLKPCAADLLFSRFGVMFFGDPDSAFANMRAWLKPSGRIVFACWRKPAENPWMMVPLDAAYAHVPRLPKPEPEDPGPFSFAREERVTRIMTSGGFTRPSFEAVDLTLDIAGGKGLDAAVAQALQIGATSRALEGRPESMRSAVAASVREALAPYAAGDEVRLAAAIWVVSAAVAAH